MTTHTAIPIAAQELADLRADNAQLRKALDHIVWLSPEVINGAVKVHVSELIARRALAHRTNCPGCELCIADFREYPQRARPELDLDSAGRPLRSGS